MCNISLDVTDFEVTEPKIPGLPERSDVLIAYNQRRCVLANFKVAADYHLNQLTFK